MKFSQMTIRQIKEWMLETADQDIQRHFRQLKKDERQGVQQLTRMWEKKQQARLAKEQHWEQLQQIEQELRKEGYTLITGVDEVGRGPLAGPVVAAAVILPLDFRCIGLNDSKQLSKENRESFDIYIREHALDYHIAYVDAKEIDRINIYQATIKAMGEALRSLHISPDYALIDAVKLSLPYPSLSLVKGDTRSVSIAAASVMAKVSRDSWMEKIAELYPTYGFERNMGYGTKEHLDALERYGATPIHRKTFLSQQLEKNPRKK